jgi:DNA-binding NtrC family response regulator
LLQNHPWPGNVRALRHACERAVIMAQGARYGVADFGIEAACSGRVGAAPATLVPGAAAAAATGDAALNLDALEREAVSAALVQSEGNISHAAKRLGLSRAALYRRMEKHGLRSDVK